MRLPLLVSVLGWSGTGKTTFIEAAIHECKKRSIDVAVIKKSRHEADLSPGTKDSGRFFSAGAIQSIYLSESAMVRLSAPPSRCDSLTIAGLCPEARIVFCEGLDVDGAVRVLMAGPATSEEELKRPLSEIHIFVATHPDLVRAAEEKNIATFGPGQIRQFVDYLVSREE